MNWMDICIIIIIVISAFSGLSKGLVLSVFSIGSYILAFIAAKVYHPYLSRYIIDNTNLIPRVQKYVFDKINIAQGISPDGHDNIFQAINLPKSLEDTLLKSAAITEYSNGLMGNIHGYISEVITKVILDLACIIIIFLVVKLALNLIGALFNGIASLPVINQFNRLGGFLFGIVKGVLIIFVLTALMVPITSIFNESFITEGLKNSTLAGFFYDYNIILNMMDQVINNIG